MRVTSRKVTRYYALRRSFATKAHAYQAVAKREIDNDLFNRGYDLARQKCPVPRDIPFEAWSAIVDASQLEVLAQSFPGDCRKSNTGINLTTMRHGSRGNFISSYCNGCRWDAIKRRAIEMQAEDEGRRVPTRPQPSWVKSLPAPKERTA